MKYLDILEAHYQHNQGATKDEEDKFHTDLDDLVHKTFGASSDEKDKADEAALAVHGDANLMHMVKTIFDDWNSKKHSKEEIEKVLGALGYKIEFNGDRAEMVKEAPGDIRKGLGAMAIIAALGMNMPSAQDTPLGQAMQQAADAGDPVAAEHLDKLD